MLARSLATPEAFGALFDRHAGTVLRYLARRVGANDADGLLGEVFRIAFERRRSFDVARASVRPWLYGIATNLLLKHRRSEGRALRAWARVAATRERPADSEERSIALADARALLPKVIDALEAIPDGERDALLLFVWEEQSYEDIAAALAVPVGTVRSRLNRARQRLRELATPTGKQRRQTQPKRPRRAKR